MGRALVVADAAQKAGIARLADIVADVRVRGDAALMELLITAQFDTGHYRRIRLETGGGRAIVERQSQRAPLDAPAWFVGLLPLDVVVLFLILKQDRLHHQPL